MRRVMSVLVGLVLLGAVVAVAPAEAAKAETTLLVVIVADEGFPEAGSTASYEATLRAGNQPVADATVTLFSRAPGSKAYRVLAQGTTDAQGVVDVAAKLYRNTRLHWSFKGDTTHAGTASDEFGQQVESKVRARPHDATIARGQTLEVYGRSFPAKAGYKVSLWRGQRPCFCAPPAQPNQRLAAGRIGKDGSFRLTTTFATAQHRDDLFVIVQGGGGTRSGYSPYFKIQVR